MKTKLVKYSISILAVAMLLTINTQLGYSSTTTIDKTPNMSDFMTNVIGLNLSNYTVQSKTTDFDSKSPSGILFDKMVKYNLTSSESSVDVLSLYRDEKLVWCKIYPIKGQVLFAPTNSTDNLNSAKAIVDKLQNYPLSSSLPTIQSLLLSTTALDNSSKISSGITQKMTTENNATTFMWTQNADGIENNYKAIVLTIQNGNFEFFCDNWDLYSIGSTHVMISQKQAIEIAKENAFKKYSDPEKPTFAILDKEIGASLTMQDKGNYTLYPHWEVLLPLDRAYGTVTAIRVLVWADNGEVSYIEGVGTGGTVLNEDTSSNTDQLSENAVPQQSYLIILVLVAAAILLSLGYFLYKKRK